jgi:hypothetical protein
MPLNFDIIPYLQHFLQLNFLFSGIEVSPTYVLLARLAFFIVLGIGLSLALFHIAMKILDCLQTLIQTLGHMPKSFFLLLILVVPLFPDSIGARWMGYILLMACVFALTLAAAVLLVLWKYGVDQAVRFMSHIRARGAKSEVARTEPRGRDEEADPPIMSPSRIQG